MTSLTERLSAVRQSQWETQLDVFRTLSNRAIDNAEQLFALNMKTSRATVEGAAGTLQQLMRVNDPRDLLAIGSQAQGQWQHMFAYSRELLGIAMGARQRNWSGIPNAAPAPLPAPAQLIEAPMTQVAEQVAIAVADATTITTEMTAAATDIGTATAEATMSASQPIAAAEDRAGDATPDSAPTELEEEKAGEAPSEVPPAVKESDDGAAAPQAAATSPAPSIDEETSANVDALVDTLIAEETPPAKPKPLAEALNQIVPKPASVEHPIASTVPLEANGRVELPVVTPPESAPPAQTSQGPQTERRRSSRKK